MAIIRQHNELLLQSVAVYSDCEKYRYGLTRLWAETGGKVTFVMLNPSTATEVQNDPTVERCERRARAMGFGAFQVVNIFAFRATDPKDMRRAQDPIGPDNDAAIADACAGAAQIICAWGTHGAHLGRGLAVTQMLTDQGFTLHHLGLTKDGAPKHPLYIGYEIQPMVWQR
ncbi:MAG: DUF1643 domain-containing protein [Cypionkella sp.]|nr:DUF1643 domain-containing protein [Cypionkella sp.]